MVEKSEKRPGLLSETDCIIIISVGVNYSWRIFRLLLSKFRRYLECVALLLFCGLRNHICIYTRSLCYFPNPEMLTSYPLEHKQNTFSLFRVFLVCFFFVLIFGVLLGFFFLAVPHVMRDLSSLTRDPTRVPCSGSMES